MFEFLTGLFLDLLLIGGIILLSRSPFKKFRENRKVFIPLGILFIVIGIVFIDWNAAQEAFWEGYHSAR